MNQRADNLQEAMDNMSEDVKEQNRELFAGFGIKQGIVKPSCGSERPAASQPPLESGIASVKGKAKWSPMGQSVHAIDDFVELPSKYHSQRTGHYHSKKEALYARDVLAARKKAGEISFWLEQVPFRLPGGTTYRLDFMTFSSWGDEGKSRRYSCEFIEVKGMKIRLGEIKRKQCEELYGIHIEEV